MKTAFRNFLTTLCRYKTASLLNVVGLTAAFLAFYVIMAQVRYDLTFNHSIKDSERLYLTAISRPQGDERATQLGSDRLTTERVIEACPDVETSGIFKRPVSSSVKDRGVWVKNDEYDFDKFPLQITEISMSILDILGFKAVEGDLSKIDDPGNIIISQSAAELMGVSIGDVVFEDEWITSKRSKPVKPYNVVGIYKDFASNTMLRGTKVVKKYVEREGMRYPTAQGPALLYVVKLHKNCTPDKFTQMWNDDYGEWVTENESKIFTGNLDYFRNTRMELTSLREMYYKQIMFAENGEQSSIGVTRILIVLAVLIIAIAFINYFNFFMAMIPIRLRAVNISKVFGATKAQLRRDMLFESVAMSLLSFGLALYLILALQDLSFLREFFTCSLALSDNLETIGWIVAFTIFIAIISAIYPSWYVTSFNPALGVKGGFAGSQKGRRLRVALICMQFVVSLILIIYTISSWVNYARIQTFEYKVPVENTVTFQPEHSWVGARDKNGENKIYILLEELQRSPLFVDGTFSNSPITWGVTGLKIDGVENGLSVSGGTVYHNFLDYVGVPVVEGRNFSAGKRGRNGEWIISRSLQREFALNVGDILEDIYRNKGVIVGIIDDMELTYHRPTPYIALFATGHRNVPYYSLKCANGVSFAEAKKEINDVMQELRPDTPDTEVFTIENKIDEESRGRRIISTFTTSLSLIAIAIALMGVAGIVMFETQFRRREIAIRKVFGATNLGMIWMFNRQYLYIILVCFFAAIPIAKLCVDNDFLPNYVGLRWWMYALALLLVLTITHTLVSYRCWHAANENPADVVKSE